MSKAVLKEHTSPAMTYPEPIDFDTFEDFLEKVESAIGGLEGAGVDFIEKDALQFLKGMNPETAGQDLRWLGDLIERNFDRFKYEIETRESDDGVDFLEDGALPAGRAA